ncbi:MAG: tetratricopeptide repeat protein, partial [Phycisphaerales bacterium]|nr:tetratricopeptide repeat protein [Phycisphaerales bacterium]
LATVYMNQDRFDVARRTLEAALKMAPDLAIVHERMGFCEWRTGNHEAAARSYRQAIAISRKSARAFAGLGVVLMNQFLDDPSKAALRDEAIEVWHQSLEIDPQQPKIRELINKYRPRNERPTVGIE